MGTAELYGEMQMRKRPSAMREACTDAAARAGGAAQSVYRCDKIEMVWCRVKVARESTGVTVAFLVSV